MTIAEVADRLATRCVGCGTAVHRLDVQAEHEAGVLCGACADGWSAWCWACSFAVASVVDDGRCSDCHGWGDGDDDE